MFSSIFLKLACISLSGDIVIKILLNILLCPTLHRNRAHENLLMNRTDWKRDNIIGRGMKMEDKADKKSIIKVRNIARKKQTQINKRNKNFQISSLYKHLAQIS